MAIKNSKSILKNLKPMMGEFSLSHSETVLDAGCGYGVRSVELGRDVGSHVISIDLSMSCLKAVKKEKRLFNIDLIQADLQNLPLKEGVFDKIVSGDVLEHVPDVLKTLKGFYRVTKQSGLVFLLVPSSVSEKLFLRLDETYLERIGHLRTFESAKLLTLVEMLVLWFWSVIGSSFSDRFIILFQVLQRAP